MDMCSTSEPDFGVVRFGRIVVKTPPRQYVPGPIDYRFLWMKPEDFGIVD